MIPVRSKYYWFARCLGCGRDLNLRQFGTRANCGCGEYRVVDLANWTINQSGYLYIPIDDDRDIEEIINSEEWIVSDPTPEEFAAYMAEVATEQAAKDAAYAARAAAERAAIQAADAVWAKYLACLAEIEAEKQAVWDSLPVPNHMVVDPQNGHSPVVWSGKDDAYVPAPHWGSSEIRECDPRDLEIARIAFKYQWADRAHASLRAAQKEIHGIFDSANIPIPNGKYC